MIMAKIDPAKKMSNQIAGKFRVNPNIINLYILFCARAYPLAAVLLEM
jgi:hypothetical protein